MATKYYQKNKETFRKRHVKDIKIFLMKRKGKSEKRYEEEKENKRQYYREQYINRSEDQKQRLVE